MNTARPGSRTVTDSSRSLTSRSSNDDSYICAGLGRYRSKLHSSAAVIGVRLPPAVTAGTSRSPGVMADVWLILDYVAATRAVGSPREGDARVDDCVRDNRVAGELPSRHDRGCADDSHAAATGVSPSRAGSLPWRASA